MISFSGCNNVNFTGIKIPKFQPSSIMPKIKEALPADMFCKQQSVPQSLIEDGISEKTYNKAKKLLMKTVKDIYPKESMLIIKNDKIVDYRVCTSSGGNLTDNMRRLCLNPDNKIILMHSHPKTGADTTCPPSIGDWDTLNKYPGMKSLYVISADGEYAVLRKINSAGLPDKEANNEIGRFMFGYTNYLDKMNMPVCNELVQLFNWGTDMVSMGADSKALSNRFVNLANNIDHAGLTVDYVDGFWKKFGDKLNVTYESNLNKLR